MSGLIWKDDFQEALSHPASVLRSDKGPEEEKALAGGGWEQSGVLHCLVSILGSRRSPSKGGDVSTSRAPFVSMSPLQFTPLVSSHRWRRCFFDPSL